jgi:predicted enzyme related to lactoylglutathione lyase
MERCSVGLMRPTRLPLHVLSHADVDAAADKAVSLGGSIFVPSADIPDIGRFAGLMDPHGAMFFIFKPVA